MSVSSYMKGLMHVLLPRLCLSCDDVLLAHEELLCTSCIYHLPFTDFHLDADNETARQLWGKLPVLYATSMLYLSKSSRVEELLHRLKYGNLPKIGTYLGRLYAHRLKLVEELADVDLIVPIPIHRSKLRKRKYNQAATFAKGIAEVLSIPWSEDILIRAKHTVSQTKMKRVDRYDNVEGVFEVTNASVIDGMHILLVDDVLTTGATLSTAGNELIKRGARLSIATIARA